MKLEGIPEEVAKDLIPLINSLGTLEKTAKVDYTSKSGQRTKFSYVPIDDMLAAVKKDGNFAFIQPLGTLDDGSPCIQCVLIHKSGYCITSDPYRLRVKENASKQDEGSEITYSRRYCMASFFGIASDEDNDASGEPQEKESKGEKQKPAQQKKKPTMSEGMSARLNEAVVSYCNLTGMKTKEVMAHIQKLIGKTPAQMTDDDGAEVLNMIKKWSDEEMERLGM